MKLLLGDRAELQNQRYWPVEKKYWQSWTFLVFTLACFWHGEFKTVLPREVAHLSVSEGWEDIQEESNKNCLIFYTCLRIFSSRCYWDTRCKKSWVFSVLCFSIFRVLPRAVMATPLPHCWPLLKYKLWLTMSFLLGDDFPSIKNGLRIASLVAHSCPAAVSTLQTTVGHLS